MKRFGKFAVLATAVGILAAVGPLSLASAKGGPKSDPKGNNGTVKIDGVAFDDAPNNEPHVGCSFQVDFYGYDQGDLNATVTFEGQAPTGGGTLLTDTIAIGEDAASGGTDLDASRTYDLSAALANVTPQPNQGDHVKLTVNADGSQGADVKHKVFWVSGCGGDQGGGRWRRWRRRWRWRRRPGWRPRWQRRGEQPTPGRAPGLPGAERPERHRLADSLDKPEVPALARRAGTSACPASRLLA